MWAASAEANVTLSPGMIEELLRRTARPFPDSSCDTSLCGQGILDADAALAAAADPAAILGGTVGGSDGGGGGGCVLVANTHRGFDPLFLLLLMAAVGRWHYRRR